MRNVSTGGDYEDPVRDYPRAEFLRIPCGILSTNAVSEDPVRRNSTVQCTGSLKTPLPEFQRTVR